MSRLPDLPLDPPEEVEEREEEDPDSKYERMRDEWPKIGQFYTPED